MGIEGVFQQEDLVRFLSPHLICVASTHRSQLAQGLENLPEEYLMKNPKQDENTGKASKTILSSFLLLLANNISIC